MKLTAKRLKQIIREEMEKLSEAPWEPPHAYGDSPSSLDQSLKQRSGRPGPMAAPSNPSEDDKFVHYQALYGVSKSQYMKAERSYPAGFDLFRAGGTLMVQPHEGEAADDLSHLSPHDREYYAQFQKNKPVDTTAVALDSLPNPEYAEMTGDPADAMDRLGRSSKTVSSSKRGGFGMGESKRRK